MAAVWVEDRKKRVRKDMKGCKVAATRIIRTATAWRRDIEAVMKLKLWWSDGNGGVDCGVAEGQLR